MVFLFCFATKYYFLSLFTRIRIETRFPLISSSINNFAFDDKPSARSLMTDHQQDHLYISRIVVDKYQKQPPRGVPRKKCSENM